MKMKISVRANLTILMLALAFATAAQTTRPGNGGAKKIQNGPNKPTVPDTSTKISKTKTEKEIDKGEAYIKLALEKKNMLKSMFPSKRADTVYAIIAGIDYRDPNLKLLKQKIDKVKNTKGLTSGYHSGTVVIKIFYKPGNASLLYDNLDDDIKDLFEVEEMEGARVILNYRRVKTAENMAGK